MRPDIVQTHPFIDQWRAKGYQYYIVPKAMLRSCGKQFGLGMDEVMLYVILRDRANLSFENKWLDERGRVYIIYTREEAAKYLGWSVRKTVDVFARLVKSGLLTEISQKGNGVLNAPKRLYVRQWAEASVLHPVEELQKGGFSYLTEDTIYAETGEYYTLPQCLLQDPIYEGLGLRAALVYMMALDKLHLSIKYGKVDERGLVWCTLDTQEVCDELGCNAKTLGREYKTLEEIGLIVRVRNGSNTKAQYRLYLRDYLSPPHTPSAAPPGCNFDGSAHAAPHAENSADGVGQNCMWGGTKMHVARSISASGASQNCTREQTDLHAGRDESTYPGEQNMHPNYPSYPSPSNSFSGISIAAPAIRTEEKRILGSERLTLSALKAENAIKLQLEYPDLLEDILSCMPGEWQDAAAQLLDMSIRLMTGDAVYPGTEIRLGDQWITKEEALTAYRGIDRYILFTMLTKILPRLDNIRNLKLYLHQSLLQAAANHAGEAFYTKLSIQEQRAQAAVHDDGAKFW